MVELEFPSIQYFYHEQRRHGARVEVVSTPDQIRIDMDKLLGPSTKPRYSCHFTGFVPQLVYR